MRLFRRIISTFSLSNIDKDILNNEIRLNCFKRTFYLLYVAIVVCIFYLLRFNFQLKYDPEIRANWFHAITHFYTIMLGINVLLLLIAYYIRNKNLQLTKWSLYFTNVVFLVIPFWGAILTAIDQLIVISIIAYVVFNLIATVVIIKTPKSIIGFFLFSYTLLFIFLYFTQPDFLTRVDEIADGFAITLVCIVFSLVFWQSNITKYRQARLIDEQRKDLIAKNASLVKINATKDKFFSIISHDLKGHLNGAHSLTKLMQNGEFITTPEEREQTLNLLENSLGSASRLLEDLLYWARSQTGAIQFNPTRLNLYKVVENGIELQSLNASNKQITLDNKVSKEIEVMADAEMLNTILRNLLSNAIKFTKEGGYVSVEASIKQETSKQMVSIAVTDNGVGMMPQVINKLFEISNTFTSLGTHKEKGTGLGLILCKEFVTAHGGTIEVQSEKDKGSSFIFTIPTA